jgi:thiamine pyrophosphate-dependent acetolactate synthase large subunit-like protein
MAQSGHCHRAERCPLSGGKADMIALCGDGGFNMLMCEFLTAAQHKLPVKAVVYNTSSLGLITLEAESMGLPL